MVQKTLVLLAMMTANFPCRSSQSQSQSRPKLNITAPDVVEFDFVIVGSGSAGSVIANRMSEINNWNILLLEAGKPEPALSEIPFFAPVMQFTDYNWGYSMEPQRNICLAMENQVCPWPRGKALGGSTVINYMIYTRGNPEDYERWAAMGNPGWSYKDVLPYFLKSENANLDKYNSQYHNKNGYLSIEYPFKTELSKAFIKGGKELGYKSVDYNGPEQFGFSRVQATLKSGRRHSVARAFLEPIVDRPNLRIVTGARVTKILIKRTSKRAYGVKFIINGKETAIRAKKEVIVAAGALSSPQLLMLSGIGPRNHLEKLNIPVVRSLPVGELLYDHISFPGLVININKIMEPVESFYDLSKLRQWYQSGTGPFSDLAGVEGLAYIKTNVSTEKGDYPDIELILSGIGSLLTDNGLINRRSLKISDEYYNKMYRPLQGTPSFTILPMLLHPKSRGYMKLRSSNPLDSPKFYGNSMTDPENIDRKTFIAAIRFIQRLCKTTALQKYNAHINPKPFVGCENLKYDSDEYWACALQLMTTTLHHQVATCKMGPINDVTSVVNHELKVHGIGSLRVADTSIIPMALSAHTNAPAIMVGEKAADLIKETWGVL